MATPNIQAILVPRRSLKHGRRVEVAHLWRPLNDIGGDYLYFERGENDLWVEIGDVIGHDTHSGLIMTALHGLIFGLRQSLTPLHEILGHANAFLCRLQELEKSRDPDGNYHPLLTSMFLLHVDLKKRVMTYSNAGHPFPLYLSCGTECAVLPLKSAGPPLALKPDATYRSYDYRPAPGDTVLMFTDGVTEAENEAEEQFGAERLDALLRDIYSSSPREIVEAIDGAVTAFRQSQKQTDDVAVAVLQFGPNW